MAGNLINLDSIRVANPCPVSWHSMTGDEHLRFCCNWRLNVDNLSELTHAQAETLLGNTAGSICGRFYQRSDGTVLTQDCPVGLKALRQRVLRRAAAVLALNGAFVCHWLVGLAQDPKSCVSQVRITRKDLSTQENSLVAGTVLDPMQNSFCAGRTWHIFISH